MSRVRCFWPLVPSPGSSRSTLWISWIFLIILGVSFVCALPYDASPTDADPPNDVSPNGILPPRSLPTERLSIFGYSFNGTKDECVADTSITIAKFFIYNYVAHAFTLRMGAGYRATYKIMFCMGALFLPYYGLLMACRGLESWAMNAKGSLSRAGRGGALCVVARTKKWRPRPEDKAWCWRSKGTESSKIPRATREHYSGLELEYLSQKYVQIHGMCRLPEDGEYLLARLPTDYEVQWDTPEGTPAGLDRDQLNSYKDKECSISSNYSIIKPLIAFSQLLVAIPTIYGAHKLESRTSHGYAGYQLTVIPFALMSIINTITTLANSTYDASYMVRSSIMDEAERRGAVFDGVAGKLCESSDKIDLGSAKLIGEVGVCKSTAADLERKLVVMHFGKEKPTMVGTEAAAPVGAAVREESATTERVTAAPGGAVVGEGSATTKGKTATDVEITATVEILNWEKAPTGEAKATEAKEKQAKKNFFRSLRKIFHFVLRQQIWEGIREEAPILRWLLTWYASKKLRLLAKKFNPISTRGGSKATGTTANASTEIEGGNDGIQRINPHLTCLKRLLKRFDADKRKKPTEYGDIMILFPAIGNPKPRKKRTKEKVMYYIADIIFVFSIIAPYFITFLLTKYKKGRSTFAQRLIVILWLVLMQIACIPQKLSWNYVQTHLVTPLVLKDKNKKSLWQRLCFWTKAEKKTTKKLDLEGNEMLLGLVFIAVAGGIYSIPGMLGFFHVFILMTDDNKGKCNGALGNVVTVLDNTNL